MKVFNSLEEISNIEETVVALGNFDGIHRGHKEIIERTMRSAKAMNLKSAVFTFSNHTSTLLKHMPTVKNIMRTQEKIAFIEELGIDYMFNIPFTEEIMTMPPEKFIEDILVNKFNIKEAYCGFNYKFGFKGMGNPEVLLHEGVRRGFGIHVQEPYTIDGVVVSSTVIRGLIAEGKMEECTKFLGRMHSVYGEVVTGNKLGRTIGFPTCNQVVTDEMVTPPNGVYITYCSFDGKRYPAVTNVGVKPTIGDYNKNVETHIFGLNEDLYGKEICVEFVKMTRPEQKFDSLEALQNQIERDCIEAKAYHREKGML